MSLHNYNENLQNEIEGLSLVYFKELSLQINESSLTISIDLPIESGKYSCEKFIHVKLNINCEETYPKSSPSISLSDYWGLDDSDISELYSILRFLIDNEMDEETVICRIIEATAEYIHHNIPRTRCAICLENFINPDDIFATPAHHFFHKTCIETYAHSQIEEHTRSVAKAKSNNKFILSQDLPKLDMRCPICRSEELIFGNEPIGRIDSWVNDNDLNDVNIQSDEIVDYLKKLSLQMVRKERKETTEIQKEDTNDINRNVEVNNDNDNTDHGRIRGGYYRGRGRGRNYNNRGGNWGGRGYHPRAYRPMPPNN